MCTSLGYKDAAGNAYYGRTLELTVDLPYQAVYLPAGHAVTSKVGDGEPMQFTARHGAIAVTMPDRVPTADAPVTVADLKVLEGLNDQGLTFSVLSYPAAASAKHEALAVTQAVLSASDLGAWALGQFATVADVKAALASQPLALVPLGILGGAMSPFHYVLHDRTGAAIVVEFDKGEMHVYDNPVGVMTNGPRFDWHLTNLDNYTHLTNVDTPTATFGGYKASQPDSGIATAGLPASNTSVGRFIRAVFHAQFAEKAATPDEAVQALAHILNNFDRPRGLTVDYPQGGESHLEVKGLDTPGGAAYATEFTSWTSISDLERKRLWVRDYRSLNFATFDLAKFAGRTEPAVIPLERVRSGVWDASDIMTGPKTA
jgi:penicillin V acylase-like amidase (Ntn superfamily)